MEISSYIDRLSLGGPAQPRTPIVSRGLDGAPVPPVATDPGVVNAGSVLSFVSGLSAEDVSDVLLSVQLAQRGASGAFDRFTQTREWYGKYTEILENVGWAGDQFAFAQYSQSAGQLQMDQAALEVIAAIASSQQLDVLTKSLAALKKLAATDQPITLFELNALAQSSGNFQLGAVQRAGNDILSMAMGGFYFRATKKRQRFLFFSWGSQEIHFWTAAQKLSFNRAFYGQFRQLVSQKLGQESASYLSGLSVAN